MHAVCFVVLRACVAEQIARAVSSVRRGSVLVNIRHEPLWLHVSSHICALVNDVKVLSNLHHLNVCSVGMCVAFGRRGAGEHHVSTFGFHYALRFGLSAI